MHLLLAALGPHGASVHHLERASELIQNEEDKNSREYSPILRRLEKQCQRLTEQEEGIWMREQAQGTKHSPKDTTSSDEEPVTSEPIMRMDKIDGVMGTEASASDAVSEAAMQNMSQPHHQLSQVSVPSNPGFADTSLAYGEDVSMMEVPSSPDYKE